MGEREVFIRFCGCNISCPYCDTEFALKRVSTCLVEKEAGIREFDVRPNPIGPEELVKLLAPLLKNQKIHHSLFLTGGEPLIWGQFLAHFLPQARRVFNLPITLETNGTLPSELARVLPWIDIISMDYKLPSTMGGANYADAHKEFLLLAKSKDVFLKFVLTASVGLEELREAFAMVHKLGDFPIVLQPVTPVENIQPPSEVLLLKMQEIGKEFFSRVKVLPQMHKLMRIR